MAGRTMRVPLVNFGAQLVDFLVGGTEVFGRVEFTNSLPREQQIHALRRVNVVPEVLHRVGGDNSMLDFRIQKRIQQLFVSHVVLLVHP